MVVDSGSRVDSRTNTFSHTGAGTQQRGLGIIEVLVALVIVSFGVLGIAGMQLSSMKHSASSLNRSKAVMLAENMATRMRINRDGTRDQLYNDYDSDNVDCNARPVPYCQAYVGQNAKPCDRTQLAAFDRYTVACGDFGTQGANAGVRELLPPGSRLQVDCDDNPCANDSSYTISVIWTEGRNASSDEQESRRVQMRMLP